MGKAYNPKTGKIERAAYIDDYFGPHQYGVNFGDDKFYREEELRSYKTRPRIYYYLSQLRDKPIPNWMVEVIDWVRYTFFY